MDRNFFELWGRLFLSIAQGQKQIEEMESLFRQGMEGYASIMKIWGDAYPYDPPQRDASDNKDLGEGAAQNYQASVRQLMSLWGMVPKDDYQVLQQKYDALEKRAAEQERQIAQLKTLLGERQESSFSAAKELQNLLNTQQTEFQTLMDGLGVFFEEKKKTPARKK